MSAVQLKRKGSKTFRRSAANGGRRLLLSSKEATGVGQAGGTRSGRERWCLLERVLSRSLACLLVLPNSPLLAQEEQSCSATGHQGRCCARPVGGKQHQEADGCRAGCARQ